MPSAKFHTRCFVHFVALLGIYVTLQTEVMRSCIAKQGLELQTKSRSAWVRRQQVSRTSVREEIRAIDKMAVLVYREIFAFRTHAKMSWRVHE
jgi:sensor histidine kinase regulating citrate/malate metabolism